MSSAHVYPVLKVTATVSGMQREESVWDGGPGPRQAGDSRHTKDTGEGRVCSSTVVRRRGAGPGRARRRRGPWGAVRPMGLRRKQHRGLWTSTAGSGTGLCPFRVGRVQGRWERPGEEGAVAHRRLWSGPAGALRQEGVPIRGGLKEEARPWGRAGEQVSFPPSRDWREKGCSGRPSPAQPHVWGLSVSPAPPPLLQRHFSHECRASRACVCVYQARLACATRSRASTRPWL